MPSRFVCLAERHQVLGLNSPSSSALPERWGFCSYLHLRGLVISSEMTVGLNNGILKFWSPFFFFFLGRLKARMLICQTAAHQGSKSALVVHPHVPWRAGEERKELIQFTQTHRQIQTLTFWVTFWKCLLLAHTLTASIQLVFVEYFYLQCVHHEIEEKKKAAFEMQLFMYTALSLL